MVGLLAGLSLLAIAVSWPISSGLGSVVVGSFGQDSTGAITWLWTLQQEGGFRLTGSTLHTLTGAPLGWIEGNGLNIQWALPYYPAFLATKVVGEVVAYNLVILSGLVLSGAAMYALTRYLGCHPAVCAWAALVYVLFPWHLERVLHGSLVHLEALPLLVLALVAVSRAPGDGRRRTWLLAGVGAANLAAWTSSGYYGAMALVATAAFAGAVALAQRERLAAERLRAIVGVAGSAVVAAAVVYGIGKSGSVDTAIEQFGRTPVDLEAYGLRLHELVVPTSENLLLGGWTESFLEARRHSSNGTETANYVGLLTIALAVTGLVVAWRASQAARAVALGLGAVVVVAVLFALPSPLLGIDVMPSRLLFEFVSSGLRVPSRWIVLVMTALVPLAALGLQAVWRALASRSGSRLPAARYGIVAGAFVISFLELYSGPIAPTFRVPPVPDVYRAVAEAPDGTLAEYPLRRSDIYLFWQREHGRPIVNVRLPGAPADDVARTLVDPRAPGTAAALASLGVTAIVTRADALSFAEDGFPPVPDADWGPGYALIERFPDGSSVWRVTADPAPAVVTLPSPEFGRPASPVGGTVLYRLQGADGRLEIRSDSERVVRLRFDVHSEGERRRTLLLRGAEGEIGASFGTRTSISALVRLPRGCSRLAVEVEPSDSSAVAFSAPWAESAPDESGELVGDAGC